MLRMKTLAVAMGLAATASLSLTGCGGTGQDQGEVTQISQVVAGRAIDGDIARAMVFQDTNNNGRRDAWEAFAFTDNNGYFSFSPVTDSDYCAPTASDEEQQYCLRIAGADNEAVIRVDGGYDRLTNEPFVGQLSRRISRVASQPEALTIISPITSVLATAGSAEEYRALMDRLEIDERDVDQDYLNRGGIHSADARLLNLALKLHKTTTVLAENLTHIYDAIGSERNTPNDASAMVYRHLVHELLQTPGVIDEALTNPQLLQQVVRSTEAEIQQLYTRFEFDAPRVQPTAVATVARRAAAIPALVDKLVDKHAVEYSLADAKGRSSALEVVVLKSSGKQRNTDADIAQAVDFFLSDAKADLAAALVRELSSDSGDASQLSHHSFARLTSEEEIATVARIPADAEAFTGLTGKSIRISDLDLGVAPHALDDSEVELYFQGDYTATEGHLSACVKHIDDAHQNGSLGEANTRGELVNGYWSLLGATGDNNASHNVLLTINFLGARYQAILKTAGREIVGGKNLHKVRFDHNGELTSWYSENGLQPLDHLPKSNADCRERLPSRIGI